MEATKSRPTSKARTKLRREYTLDDLRTSVALAMREMVQPGGEIDQDPIFLAPSMATLKLWSKNGLLDEIPFLASATRLVVKKQMERQRYYPKLKGSTANDITTDSSVAKPSKIKPESFNSNGLNATVGDSLLACFKSLQSEIGALTQRINDIANSIQLHRQPGRGYEAPPVAVPQNKPTQSDAEKVIQAIAQLDALRKHLMLRMDSEIQLMKPASTAGRQFEGASALDIQRVLAKVSNVEALVNRVLQSN